MIMQATDMDGIYNFLNANKDKINSFKITSMTAGNFNSWEGYQWQINVKIFTKEGYRNKLVAVLTNSSYLDEFDLDESGNCYVDSEHSEEENAIHAKTWQEEAKLNIEDWLAGTLE